MNRVLTRLALAGSGAILGLISSALLVSPRAFLETSGILVDHDPGLMSELSAPAGILLVTGALMILGAVRLRFANAGLAAGVIVYGTYGAGRLVSMALHGVPSQALIVAMMVELGIAAILAVLWMNTASRQQPAGRRYHDIAI
jgi:hypothetical protein